MTKFNFSKTREDAEKKFDIGSNDYLKIKEGENKMRLLSKCVAHPSTYEGKTTFKWLCYVIDRVDGKIKPYFMPVTIYKQIEGLQLSDDYGFTTVPMPYDFSVNAIGAGQITVKYTVIPARANTPLTDDEEKALAETPTLNELQKKLLERDAEKAEEQPAPPSDEPDINVEDIPFKDTPKK